MNLFSLWTGCGGQWWCCSLTVWSVLPLLLLLLWPKAFGGDAGSTAQCSTAPGIERDRTSKEHEVCLRSLTIPLKSDLTILLTRSNKHVIANYLKQ